MNTVEKALAAACGALLMCCSAPAPEADEPSAPTIERVTVPSPTPPPPPSPLPSGFNLPGPGAAPAAPLGTSRVLWATAGSSLLTLTSDAPAKVDARPVSGLAKGEQLFGLDFRKNGTLYAIGSTSRLFSVAHASATASAISYAPFAEPLDGVAFGFGFDPVSDLARVTSNTAENLRVEADTGTVTNVDGSVHFFSGDVHVGSVPRVTAVAYAADGTGYAIDAKTGSLVRLRDSYSGEIETVGSLGVAAFDVSGFDISGADAFAALRVGAVTSLYAVDLATGAVTARGTIGDGGPLTGLAIQP